MKYNISRLFFYFKCLSLNCIPLPFISFIIDLWRGLRQVKQFNRLKYRLKETTHCQCCYIISDKKTHSYEQYILLPTSKPSHETTGNKYHNDKSNKEQSYEQPCPSHQLQLLKPYNQNIPRNSLYPQSWSMKNNKQNYRKRASFFNFII